MTRNVERILKVNLLQNRKTNDRENMVNLNIAEKQLRNFIRERDIQKGTIENTTEISGGELLANEQMSENKIECRALLETLCEI